MRCLLIMILMILVLVLPGVSAPFASYAPGQVSGLMLLDVPDGRWDKINFEGRDAVRLREDTRPESYYLYFRITDELRSKLGSDIYLVVDFFDNDIGSVGLEYDSASHAYTPGAGFYTAPSKKWDRALLHIADAKFTGRQNGGADFRFSCRSKFFAIAKVEVYTHKPDSVVPLEKDRILKYIESNNIKTDMFYTFGNDADPSQAMLFKALGVTSVESYVSWETVERAGENNWDWSQWDKQVAVLKEAGLKWVPFLILSPAYSTPNWFRNSKEHFPCRCLEHGTDSKIESLWNPNLPKWIDRFIKAFADRYKDSGVIESVLLGIQGDFGEAIYSVTGGGWTFSIPGEYHNHAGFWCDDPYALSDYRSFLKKRYRTVSRLNKAWNTKYRLFSDADFPARGEKLNKLRASLMNADGHTKRQWIDFIDWYRESMTEWADWWMGTTRKYFPGTPIYLCTGGDAPPEHGSNFAEQCRVSAKHNAGVRITNEASNYAFNFSITRWVASAGKYYGAYFGFEPAGNEDEKGIIARIYNATASGANQLHDYNPNVVSSSARLESQRKHFKYLFHVPKPVVPVALWYPNVHMTLKWGRFLDKSARLRDYIDHDFVDETMLRNGALDNSRILVIAHGSIMEPKDATKIAAWIRKGGQAIVADVPAFTSVEGTSEPETILFGITPKGRTIGKGKIARVSGWDALARSLSESMSALGLSYPEIKLDGVFATQIGPDRFLFLNTENKKMETNIMHGGKSVPVTVEADTIADIKL